LRRHSKRHLWSSTVSASSVWSVSSSFASAQGIGPHVTHSTGVRDSSTISSNRAAVTACGDCIINTWAIKDAGSIYGPAAVNAKASTGIPHNDMSTDATHTGGVRRRVTVGPTRSSSACASAATRIPSIGKSPTTSSSAGGSIVTRSLTAETNAGTPVDAFADRAGTACSIRILRAHALSAATNRGDG
jgi:hypothetical protein